MAYITRIQLAQCRNIRNLDIDLSPGVGQGFRHLILTGPNGSGKTGVLERMASWIEGSSRSKFRKELHWAASPEPSPAGLNYVRERGEFIAAYLPAFRALTPAPVSGPKRLDWKGRQLGPRARVSDDFLQFLVNRKTDQAFAAADGDEESAATIAGWFERLERHFRRLMEDPQLTFEFQRGGYTFEFTRGDGHRFDFATLAAGHSAVMSVLAELFIRIDVARQAKQDQSYDPCGVVLIDEIDAHLHLELQEQILPFLVELFPRLQFIVATHSPAVIASVPGAVVYDLEKREQLLSDAFRGVHYGTLMIEHFGLSSDFDLDSTSELERLAALDALPTRSPADESELRELAKRLAGRSHSLALEVWTRLEYERLKATKRAEPSESSGA